MSWIVRRSDSLSSPQPRPRVGLLTLGRTGGGRIPPNRERWPALGGLIGQFVEQVGAGLDSPMKVGKRELLVGAMKVIVALAPTQEQRVNSQVLFDKAHHRDRTAFAHEDRLGAKPLLDS